MPAWYCGQLGKGWTCHVCGCSSVRIRAGRHYGPKAKEWPALMKEFDDDIRHCILIDKEWALEWVVMPEVTG